MIKKKWADILQIISGKNQKDVVDESGQYPIYGSGGIIGYANDYLCEAGTTIVGRKGTINNPIFVNERFWNVDTAFGIFPGETLHPKFLFYFCQLFNFKALDKSTTIPSLAKRDLLNIEMPVPPLPDQERIVSRIEELFSQLDASVAELKTAKERLKVYRQAVLKEAFAFCSETVRICELCDVVRGGSPRSAGDTKYYDGVIPFLKVADLTNTSEMYLTTFTSTIKEAGLKKTRLVPANTLLLSNSGATLGQHRTTPTRAGRKWKNDPEAWGMSWKRGRGQSRSSRQAGPVSQDQICQGKHKIQFGSLFL